MRLRRQWVRCSAADSAALIAQMLPLVLHKLDSLAGARNGNPRTIQGLLCGTLQVEPTGRTVGPLLTLVVLQEG